MDMSGSSALIVMIIEKQCYIINVGSSRAVLSADSGKSIVPLSRDHKPGDPAERIRVKKAGGKIFQEQIIDEFGKHMLGPERILPGKLTLTRCFGDIYAKDEALGNQKGVVIAVPEIVQFEIMPNHDFIILASDGIFDTINNQDAILSI